MSDYSDRRKEFRKNVLTFILVYDLEGQRLLGYLRDLTMNGACISGEKDLAINTELTLSIKLPDDLSGVQAEKLNIPSKVTRCVNATESPDSYDIGFKFTDLESEEKEIIEKLLERYHFRHQAY